MPCVCFEHVLVDDVRDIFVICVCQVDVCEQDMGEHAAGSSGGLFRDDFPLLPKPRLALD